MTNHDKEHQLLAEALLEYETLSADEVRQRPTPAAVKRSNETRQQHTPLIRTPFLVICYEETGTVTLKNLVEGAGQSMRLSLSLEFIALCAEFTRCGWTVPFILLRVLLAIFPSLAVILPVSRVFLQSSAACSIYATAALSAFLPLRVRRFHPFAQISISLITIIVLLSLLLMC
ncbi:unnamed protein product [Cylicostephanus goldi]|uniref:Uncharacterized protein n=1 Tax=Cylicostephanus goldi TaxID=71465 RepID=A0A3P6RFG4_CYLGO|nr:unnamed protein product [Cylicostephanus goldi]